MARPKGSKNRQLCCFAQQDTMPVVAQIAQPTQITQLITQLASEITRLTSLLNPQTTTKSNSIELLGTLHEPDSLPYSVKITIAPAPAKTWMPINRFTNPQPDKQS